LKKGAEIFVSFQKFINYILGRVFESAALLSTRLFLLSKRALTLGTFLFRQSGFFWAGIFYLRKEWFVWNRNEKGR